MEQKPQLKLDFSKAVFGVLGATFLGAGVALGTVAGMGMALPDLPAKAALIPAAAGIMASFFSGLCAAEAWRTKYPEGPEESVKYARDMIFRFALGATLFAGMNGYWLMDNIVDAIKETRPPDITTASSLPPPLPQKQPV